MKKVIALTLSFLFISISSAFANNKDFLTPSEIHQKIIENSYIAKFDSLIIDKEISAKTPQMPHIAKMKSKTYFSKDKLREETQTKGEDGKDILLVSIFTMKDSFISFDNGMNFFSLGFSVIDKVSENLKDIPPFSENAVLKDNTENINGFECYIIEDTLNKNESQIFYIDKDNYNIVRSISNSKDEITITDILSYKKIEGFNIPTLSKLTVRQKNQQSSAYETVIKIIDFKANPNIKPSTFIPQNVSALPNIPGFNIEDIKDIFNSFL